MMLKRYIFRQNGLTLIEVLATITISSMILGLLTTVLISTYKQNDITKSHIDLRKEANIVITQIRQNHQNGEAACYNSLILNNNIKSDGILIGNEKITQQEGKNCTTALDPHSDYNVEFKLIDKNHANQFDLKTVIEGKREENSNVITIPIDTIDFLTKNNVFLFSNNFIDKGNSGSINGYNATAIFNNEISNTAGLTNVTKVYKAWKNINNPNDTIDNLRIPELNSGGKEWYVTHKGFTELLGNGSSNNDNNNGNGKDNGNGNGNRDNNGNGNKDLSDYKGYYYGGGVDSTYKIHDDWAQIVYLR